MKIARFIQFLSFFIFVPAHLFSQSPEIKQGAPKGWVTKVDIDKNAIPPSGQESSYYYLLLDEQENISLQERFVHYSYKILTSEGVQRMSDLSVEFDPSYENIIFHAVSIYRDGKVIDQLPKHIRTMQREESMDRHLYDGSYTAVVNLADVRVGDIIEYSYTRKGYNPVYDGYFSRRINLNYSDGYEKAFKRLLVPSSEELLFRNVNTDSSPEVDKKGDLTVYTWIKHRVNAFITDGNEPNWYDPYAVVLITNFKNWAETAAWSVKRYTISNEDRQVVLNKIYPKFKSDSPEEYALRVIRFVQDEIRYLGFESGLNSHKPHAPAEVYNQRFGDCKDKSLLLSTLLSAGGIESYPVLVNTIYRDKIAEQLPSVNAFNHCVVQVRLKEHVFYVDPTINNQGGTLDHYYFPPYGKGLVVSATSTDVVDLVAPAESSISEVQTFDIDSLGGKGIMSVQTTYRGSEAEDQRSYFSRNGKESILKNFLTYYANTYPDIEELESIQTHDDRDLNIFIVTEKYKIASFWKPYEDQDQKIYCEFYAQSLSDFFEVSRSTKRKAPYSIQHPVDYSHKVVINLPEEWNVTTQREIFETDYYQYEYNVDYKEDQISLFTHYKTKQNAVPTDAFPKFMEDHGKMMNNLSYSLSYDMGLVKRRSSKWPGAILSICSLLAGAWLIFWLYSGYDPKPYYPAAWGQPIGGWLILVAIGISVTPLRLVYEFITEGYILDGQGWLSMWYSENYVYFLFLLLEHIYNVIYLLFALLVLVLFYQRRSSVPLLISLLYGVSCLVTIFDSILAVQLDPNTEVDSKEIVRSIFAAAVWIPYFHLSLRVKKTFVNVYKDPDHGELKHQPGIVDQ